MRTFESATQRSMPACVDGRVGQINRVATVAFVSVNVAEMVTTSNQKQSEIVQKLHDVFKRMDGIVKIYAPKGVVKIETVAQSYLLCGGLFTEREDYDHAQNTMLVGLEILHMIDSRQQGNQRILVTGKVGICTGPVSGGIIGVQRRFFRLFGDTVNVAARMCSVAPQCHLCISPSVSCLLPKMRKATAFLLSNQFTVDVKGKGMMLCQHVSASAMWKPRFSKFTMSHGPLRLQDDSGSDNDEESIATESDIQQAVDLKKSFLYHRIIESVQLSRWSLRYQQTLAHVRPMFVMPVPIFQQTANIDNTPHMLGSEDVQASTGIDILESMERLYQIEFSHHLVHKRIRTPPASVLCVPVWYYCVLRYRSRRARVSHLVLHHYGAIWNAHVVTAAQMASHTCAIHVSRLFPGPVCLRGNRRLRDESSLRILDAMSQRILWCASIGSISFCRPFVPAGKHRLPYLCIHSSDVLLLHHHLSRMFSRTVDGNISLLYQSCRALVPMQFCCEIQAWTKDARPLRFFSQIDKYTFHSI